GRNARESFQQAFPGATDDLVERGDKHRHTARLDHFADAAYAQATCGDLREVVAAAFFRNARVEQQEIENVLLQRALAEQPDYGNARAFLIDLGAARHAARCDAADVGVMRDVAHEADEIAV